MVCNMHFPLPYLLINRPNKCYHSIFFSTTTGSNLFWLVGFFYCQLARLLGKTITSIYHHLVQPFQSARFLHCSLFASIT